MSRFNVELANLLAQQRKLRGFSSRKDLERILAKSKYFSPSYTVLQRIEDASRPIRPVELSEIAQKLGVAVPVLLPKVRPDKEALAEISVEQLAALSSLVKIPADELIDKVTRTVKRSG